MYAYTRIMLGREDRARLGCRDDDDDDVIVVLISIFFLLDWVAMAVE